MRINIIDMIRNDLWKENEMIWKRKDLRRKVDVGNGWIKEMIRKKIEEIEIVFIGDEIDKLMSGEMIGKVEKKRIEMEWMGERNEKRKNVWINERKGKRWKSKKIRKGGSKEIRIGKNSIMKIESIGVEDWRMKGNRIKKLRMRMEKMEEIVEEIEIGEKKIVDKKEEIEEKEIDRVGIGNGEVGKKNLIEKDDNIGKSEKDMMERLRRNEGKRWWIRENIGKYK